MQRIGRNQCVADALHKHSLALKAAGRLLHHIAARLPHHITTRLPHHITPACLTHQGDSCRCSGSPSSPSHSLSLLLLAALLLPTALLLGPLLRPAALPASSPPLLAEKVLPPQLPPPRCLCGSVANTQVVEQRWRGQSVHVLRPCYFYRPS